MCDLGESSEYEDEDEDSSSSSDESSLADRPKLTRKKTVSFNEKLEIFVLDGSGCKVTNPIAHDHRQVGGGGGGGGGQNSQDLLCPTIIFCANCTCCSVCFYRFLL